MQKYRDELKLKKHKRLLLKASVFLVLFFMASAGLVYFLFFTNLFNVRVLETNLPAKIGEDANKIIESFLDDGFWRFSGRNNILFVSSDKLVARLAGQLPKLENIRITKTFPHKITLSAAERKVAGVWCLNELQGARCFHFDKNDIAFAETSPSSGFLLPNISDYRTVEIKLGEKVAGGVWLENIMKARELLATAGIDANFIIPADSFDEFRAKTSYGWAIMFSNSTDIEKQVSALVVFLKEKITPAQKDALEYVDLRIQDRIYYK